MMAVLEGTLGSYVHTHALFFSFVFLGSGRSFVCSSLPPPWPRSGALRTQKLKSYLVRTRRLNVLPLKPGVGQYIAIHATLNARDLFLAYFYPSGPFITCFFPNLSRFFPVVVVTDTSSCAGPLNKIGHPAAGCRFPCWVPAEYNQAQKHDLWYDDLWNE